MATKKKFYWLKLKNTFFDQPKIKKLRRIAGGDTLTIIYLKMQLLSISSNGVITFEYVENDFAKELALKLDEEEDNIVLLLTYLEHQGLIERSDDEYTMVETLGLIGAESDSAARMRKLRENRKTSLCDKNVTLEIRDKRIENKIKEDKPDKQINPTPLDFKNSSFINSLFERNLISEGERFEIDRMMSEYLNDYAYSNVCQSIKYALNIMVSKNIDDRMAYLYKSAKTECDKLLSVNLDELTGSISDLKVDNYNNQEVDEIINQFDEKGLIYE